MPSICFHACSESSSEREDDLIDALLWQVSTDLFQRHTQLLFVCGFRLIFFILFQHGIPNVVIEWIQIRRVWRPFVFSNEGRAVFWDELLCLAWEMRRCAILLENEVLLYGVPAVRKTVLEANCYNTQRWFWLCRQQSGAYKNVKLCELCEWRYVVHFTYGGLSY